MSYSISVAARIVGTNLQNLRVYERHGLLAPRRSAGGNRRYSDHDLQRLHRIVALLNQGLNLVGVAQVIALEEENARLRRLLENRADPAD